MKFVIVVLPERLNVKNIIDAAMSYFSYLSSTVNENVYGLIRAENDLENEINNIKNRKIIKKEQREKVFFQGERFRVVSLETE